jgi:hypothetical protein
MIDRLGTDVARELQRFGPVYSLAPLVAAWPAAVGHEIARNAWPARVARDGTLHVHTKDSIWAFELTSRAEEIRGRLGDDAPKRIAFAPGPLPEAAPASPEEKAGREVQPSARHRAEADSLTRAIRDEDLRKVVAKTVAAGLARADNGHRFW